MSISLTIHQKGTFAKQRPAPEALRRQFDAAVHLGALGLYGTFQPQLPTPAADGSFAYKLTGKAGVLGRGFSLTIDKAYTAFTVCLPLPATAQDLEDFFTFVGLLASFLHVKEVENTQGGTLPRAALPALYAEAQQQNREALYTLAAEHPGTILPCVRMPLRIPETLCRRITSVPPQAGEKYFSAYLSEKQARDHYYMMPQPCRPAQGAPYFAYTLPEGAATILQKQPMVPVGPSPLGDAAPERWEVVLEGTQVGQMGTLSYAQFLQALPEEWLNEFDEDHYWMRGLTLKKMQTLLEGPQETEEG